MDTESFKTAFELFNKALTAVKKIKDLLPQSPQKESIAQTLIEAEKAFKLADIQAALDMERPLQWHHPWVYLFGNQLWILSKSERVYTGEELRLLFLEAVDRERRKFERLKQKFSGTAGAKVGSKREQIPENVRIFVWRRDEERCVRCGGQEKLEFDHIIPISKGGNNTERNIQLLCEGCNREKSDKI